MKLIIESKPHYCKSISGGKKCVWWRNSTKDKNIECRHYVTFFEYLNALKDGDYSFIFNDGGVVQIELNCKGNNIIKYRYAYIPCPVLNFQDILLLIDEENSYIYHNRDEYENLDSKASDIDDNANRTREGYEGVIGLDSSSKDMSINIMDRNREFLVDYFNDMKGNEFRSDLVMIAPLRFEWSQNPKSKKEPKSHVHLGISDGRVAVSHPIMVWDFLNFIFKNFYPNEFKEFRSAMDEMRGILPGIKHWDRDSHKTDLSDLECIHFRVPIRATSS